MKSKKKTINSKPTAVGAAEELQVRFITQIRHAMVDLSIGQMELAERAGMSQSYVSEIFNLKKNLTVLNALKLVKALNPEATLEIRIKKELEA